MSRVLDGTDNPSATTFELPAVEGPIVGENAIVEPHEMPTARDLEALQEQAYKEGFELGYRAGFENGQEDVAKLIQRWHGLIAQLEAPFAELDDEVVHALGELALQISRHIVRRELHTNPGEVVAVVRETISHLPSSARNVRVRLHPEDLELVESALAMKDESQGWRLEADPLLTRGGCAIDTETSRIDASVETRIAALASRMLGGERESDREP